MLFDILQIILFILSIFSTIIIHEVLHIIGFLLQDIPFNAKLVKWHKIPINISISSKYFKGSFIELGTKKRINYIIIVIIPYLVIIPFFSYMYVYGSVFISILSIFFIISQLINFPLEFIFGVDK